MRRRAVELMFFALATVALVATSKAPRCAVETATFYVKTTCGAPAPVTFSIGGRCEVTMKGAAGTGLPLDTDNYVRGAGEDAGFSNGFNMWRRSGGTICTAAPGDGGLDLECPALSCSGTLTR